MSSELKDAIITFVRAVIAAGVATAIVYVAGVNVLSADPGVVAKGIADAFLTGALLFLGAWARNATTTPIGTPPRTARRGATVVQRPAGPHGTRTRSWADNLPV